MLRTDFYATRGSSKKMAAVIEPGLAGGSGRHWYQHGDPASGRTRPAVRLGHVDGNPGLVAISNGGRKMGRKILEILISILERFHKRELTDLNPWQRVVCLSIKKERL